MDNQLNREFDYYLANLEEMLKKYNGKVIVIKDEQVIGVYDDQYIAIQETKKDHELGTFLVQPVSPDKESYTQIYHSRVIIV